MSNVQQHGREEASSSRPTRAEKLMKWKQEKANEQENLVNQSHEAQLLEKVKSWKKKVTLVENKRRLLQEKVDSLEKALESSRPQCVDGAVQTDKPPKLVCQQQQTEEDVPTDDQELLCKETETQNLIDSLQIANETLKQSLEAAEQKVAQSEATAFEAENYCASLQKALKCAIEANDQLEKRVSVLTEENRVIPGHKSHLLESAMLYKIVCLERDELQNEVADLNAELIQLRQQRDRARERLPKVAKVSEDDVACLRAQQDSLEHEIRVCRTNIDVQKTHSSQLMFVNEVLQQQVAEVIQDTQDQVARTQQKYEEEANQSKNEVAKFVEDMQEQMTEGLQKSAAKLKEYKRQVLKLTRENRELVEQSTKSSKE